MRKTVLVLTACAAATLGGTAFAQESPALEGETRNGQGGQAQIAQEVAEDSVGWELSGFADVSVVEAHELSSS